MNLEIRTCFSWFRWSFSFSNEDISVNGSSQKNECSELTTFWNMLHWAEHGYIHYCPYCCLINLVPERHEWRDVVSYYENGFIGLNVDVSIISHYAICSTWFSKAWLICLENVIMREARASNCGFFSITSVRIHFNN